MGKIQMSHGIQGPVPSPWEHSGENRMWCFFILSRSCGPVPSRQDNSDSCLLSITLICHNLNIFVKGRQAQMHSDSVLHNPSTVANQLFFQVTCLPAPPFHECEYVAFLYVWTPRTCVSSPQGGHKRVIESLELELQTTVSHQVGIQFWSSERSEPLNYFYSPYLPLT